MKLYLAIVLAFIATICANYALYMQKRELNVLPLISSKHLFATLKVLFTNIPWLQAQGLFFLGTFIQAVAMGLAPLSIVEPINSSGVCLLALLAIYKLGEKAGPMDWAGIFSILGGLLMLGISLVGQKHEATLHNQFVLWFLIILLFSIAMASFVNAVRKRGAREPIFIAIGTGMLVGINAILIKLGVQDFAARFWNESLGSALSSPYLWLALLLAVSTFFLNQVSLQRGKAIIVVPILNGLSNLIPIFMGIVALGEGFPRSGLLILMRLGSFLLIIGGAILLSLTKE